MDDDGSAAVPSALAALGCDRAEPMAARMSSVWAVRLGATEAVGRLGQGLPELRFCMLLAEAGLGPGLLRCGETDGPAGPITTVWERAQGPFFASLPAARQARSRAAQLRAAGELLDALGRALEPAPGAGFPDFAARMDALLRSAAGWAPCSPEGPVLLRRVRAGMPAVLAAAARLPQVLCHGDLSQRNVLTAPGGTGPWVIDPEPHLGPRELDAVKLCSSLGQVDGLTELGMDGAFVNAWLPVYRAAGELWRAAHR